MTKKTYTISGMHCASCSLVIEGGLEDMGVIARANYAKQKIEVEFDEKLIAEKRIVEQIESDGYKIVS